MANLLWFRNDLRTFDHSGLTAALANGKPTFALYIIDDAWFEKDAYGLQSLGKYRARFLLETLADLRNQLADFGIALEVFRGSSAAVLDAFIEANGISQLFYQEEWTRDERLVSTQIAKNQPKVQHHTFYDQFLFHPKDNPFKSYREIPEVFTAFRKVVEVRSSVRKTLAAPKKGPRILNFATSIPSLTDLGFDAFETDPRSAFPFSGGSSSGIARLQHYFEGTQALSRYKQTRNGLVGLDYSSKISAWLANGSLSARYIYWEIKKYEQKFGANEDTYWLIFELIWRDYFKYISLKHGSNIFHIGGITNRNYSWKDDEKTLNRWISGKTNDDFVDANMRELAATGWMSNRGRQNVASFLAKNIEFNWLLGAKYFEMQLVDYDVHSNYGNWMYTSGVGNDPRDRKFNTQRQADMYDAQYEFRNLWRK